MGERRHPISPLSRASVSLRVPACCCGPKEIPLFSPFPSSRCHLGRQAGTFPHPIWPEGATGLQEACHKTPGHVTPCFQHRWDQREGAGGKPSPARCPARSILASGCFLRPKVPARGTCGRSPGQAGLNTGAGWDFLSRPCQAALAAEPGAACPNSAQIPPTPGSPSL